MSNQETVYLSIGSNLGNRLCNLQECIFSIETKIGGVLAISNVYECSSWGFQADDFLNICISLETSMQPIKLLKSLLQIERDLGRTEKNTQGYESRIIDIDILYYGCETSVNETLIIPHPEMQHRKFVLQPLADLAPQHYHPVLKKDTRNLLQECKDKEVLTKTNFELFKTRTELFGFTNFIAIEGNIGAGKTTLAQKISNDFNAKLILERFADNPFLPKFYEDQLRYAFPLEMSFLADRYQQFTDDTSQYDLFKSFMISDYDIYKSLIFAQITLQNDEFALYRKLFNLMYKEVQKPKIYVYLIQSTAKLLENINKRGRDYEQSITADYLEKINKGYLEFIKSHPEQNTLIIDIENLDFVEREEDYETILNRITDFAIKMQY